jgi:hypothetical protein
MNYARGIMQKNSDSGVMQTGKKHCRRCGRPLKDPVSIRRGYGPICYDKVMEKQCTQIDWGEFFKQNNCKSN